MKFYIARSKESKGPVKIGYVPRYGMDPIARKADSYIIYSEDDIKKFGNMSHVEFIPLNDNK